MPLSVARVLTMLRWLVIGLALAIQLYAASGSGNLQNVARALLFTAIVAVYNSLLLTARYYIVARQSRIWLAVVDGAAVTIIIGLGGGIYSPFIFLVYLLIVEAALLFTPSALLTFTAVVAMFYATAAMLLPEQRWNELSITIMLSVVLGMFIWASVCGAINRAFEQERALMRREQQLTAELNRQVVALSSLNRLSERLNASLDLDELMQSTVQELPDALSVDACVAFLANDAGQGWELGSVWYGVDEDFEPEESGVAEKPDWLKVGPLRLRRSDLDAVLEKGTVLRLPVLPGREIDESEAVLMVPLNPEEGYGGALALLRNSGPSFTQSDQEILAALARQLSLLTRNARLYELERRNVVRLQELEQMKSDFLSAVSHELRTPLTSIKASSILLLSQSVENGDLNTAKLLRNIDRNTDRLDGLVSDILDMARLQNGRIKLITQPVNLADVVHDVAATMRPLTDVKNQEIEIAVSPNLRPAQADRRRVEQILTNLLSNAYRYTPKGSRICLKIREQPLTGELLISVADNGPGIAPDEQEKVFERFYRSQNSKGGTGLGLAIARSLVELHGGRIWVESRSSAGCIFYFTLPLAPILSPLSAAPLLTSRFRN